MSRMAEQQLYIHGGYTSATSGRTFETINPANGNVLATVQDAGREDVDRADRPPCRRFYGDHQPLFQGQKWSAGSNHARYHQSAA